jgi:hypothetical protein
VGVDSDEFKSRLRSLQSRSLLAEDLLDILLTTYNYSVVSPEKGEEIVRQFIAGGLDSPDAVYMLVDLSLKAEPEKTLKVLKNHGLVQGT